MKIETPDVMATSVKYARAKVLRMVDDDSIVSTKTRDVRGILLGLSMPSYLLQQGIGPDIRILRWEHRRILRNLLRHLVRAHNWDEACGVLSVLLKGSMREHSIAKNRFKYWVTMELLHIIKVGMKPRKIQHVFETWMKKIRSDRARAKKDRVAIQLEFILFCLGHGDTEGAYQVVISLMQEREFGRDAISNLVVGLVFCHLWYTGIQKELQLKDLDESDTLPESISGSRVTMAIDDNYNGRGSVQVQESNSFQPDSNTSIRIDKDFRMEEIVDRNREVSMEADNNMKKEPSHHDTHSKVFPLNFVDSAGSDKSSKSTHSGRLPFGSIFHAHDLEPWLLPLKLPHVNQVEDYLYVQKKIHNDHYKGAVKHLQVALHSTPPVFEALLPLIQILLLGDQVEVAINEIEKFVQISDAVLPFRIKASLMEHFCSNNYEKLWSCFEETLRRDPTCNHSLVKLINMQHNGYYSAEKLLEMIALHLDATCGELSTWKEFACCFLTISQCEEDRMSMCGDGTANGCGQNYSTHFCTIPTMFKDGVSGKDWSLRCKWWLTRHFRQSILTSEVEAGELELLTYKAASAAHLYGCEFDYVVKVLTILEKEQNEEMLSILKMHSQNCVGIYGFPSASEKRLLKKFKR